jgi:hypothetical protein
VQDTADNGVAQTVHCLVATYTEPAELVRECVLRLLVAPEPLWMEKIVYVCDDGYHTAEGAKKRMMVQHLNMLGAPPCTTSCLCCWRDSAGARVAPACMHACMLAEPCTAARNSALRGMHPVSRSGNVALHPVLPVLLVATELWHLAALRKPT